MGELRRQVEYKTGWSGVRVHIANRWYPSSKTCSGCGVVKTKLRLSERTYHCDQCGLVLDRDLNAARNLAALAAEVTGGTSSPSCGATRNEPEGNPRQTRTTRAAGTATGRPTGSTPHRKATAAWNRVDSRLLTLQVTVLSPHRGAAVRGEPGRPGTGTQQRSPRWRQRYRRGARVPADARRRPRQLAVPGGVLAVRGTEF
jgi:hypothetical protein